MWKVTNSSIIIIFPYKVTCTRDIDKDLLIGDKQQQCVDDVVFSVQNEDRKYGIKGRKKRKTAQKSISRHHIRSKRCYFYLMLIYTLFMLMTLMPRNIIIIK